MLDIAQDMDVGSSESSSDSDMDLTRGRQSAVSKLQFQRGEHIKGVSLEERVRNITRHARGRDGGQKGTRSERVMKRQWRTQLSADQEGTTPVRPARCKRAGGKDYSGRVRVHTSPKGCHRSDVGARHIRSEISLTR